MPLWPALPPYTAYDAYRAAGLPYGAWAVFEKEGGDLFDVRERLSGLRVSSDSVEAGAARNTLLAYGRDLHGASELLGGRLAAAGAEELKRLGEAWMPLKRATVARKAAAGAADAGGPHRAVPAGRSLKHLSYSML